MNKVILIGRLTDNPEISTTPNGIQVSKFTLAVNRQFKNAQGEREADFPRVIAFRKTAELINQYVTKGSQIAVEGRLQTRSYDAQDGSKRFVTEVICDQVQFLESRNNQSQNTGGNHNNQYQSNQSQYQPKYQTTNDDFFDSNANVDVNEDDLPF